MITAPFRNGEGLFLLFRKLRVSVNQKMICMPAQFAAERQRAMCAQSALSCTVDYYLVTYSPMGKGVDADVV